MFSTLNPALSVCAESKICLDGLSCKNEKSEIGLGLTYLIGICNMLMCESCILADLIDIYRFFNSKAKGFGGNSNKTNGSSEEIVNRESQNVSSNDITQIASQTETEEKVFVKNLSDGDNGSTVDAADKFTTALYGTTNAILEEMREEKNSKQTITIRDVESELSLYERSGDNSSRGVSAEYSNTKAIQIPDYRSKHNQYSNLFQKSEEEKYAMPSLKRRKRDDKYVKEMGYSIPISGIIETDRLSRLSDEAPDRKSFKEKSTIKNVPNSTSFNKQIRKDIKLPNTFIRDRLVSRKTRSYSTDVSKMKNSLAQNLPDISQEAIPDSAFIFKDRIPQDEIEALESELTYVYIPNTLIQK